MYLSLRPFALSLYPDRPELVEGRVRRAALAPFENQQRLEQAR
jgi:hypothetical protein